MFNSPLFILGLWAPTKFPTEIGAGGRRLAERRYREDDDEEIIELLAIIGASLDG